MRHFPVLLISLANLSLCAAAVAQNAEVSTSVVFVSQYLERGDASTTPSTKQLKDTVSVVAAPGEYEPATVSVRAGDEGLKDVSVKLSGDLKNEMGDTIPATAVQIRLVEPFERWKDKQYASPLGDLESQANQHHEWCLPLLENALDVASRTTRRFWLTVHVPQDARPGTYHSEIVIGRTVTQVGPDLGRSVALRVLKYKVSVLPIRLATAVETGMAFFMYNNTAYYPKELITPKYQQRVLADLREHGMTTATLYVYPTVKEGQVDLTVAADRDLSFKQWMDLLKEAGLPANGLPVIWLGAENYSADVWKAVLEERIRQEWPEVVFYAVDEPGEEDRNVRVRAFMEKFDTFRKQNPQYNVSVTTAIGSPLGVQTVGHHYDLWIGCMGQETGESSLIAASRMKGKKLWTYDCMLAPVDAEMDRYYFGVWAWVSGVRGCSHWAYYDGGPRLSYVYPTPQEIIPTIGWEAVREGIDDYRYLFTLKQLADAARAAGRVDLTQDAERIFAEVKGMVTMDNYGRVFLTAQKNDGAKITSAYQRPRAEPELEIDAYDRLRWKVSQEIDKLSQALAKSVGPETSKSQ